MNKKLTAKTQKLAKKLPQEARDFSTTLVIEPEDQNLVEKKGSLYVLFDVSSQENIDPLLITKVVHDVLLDSYYGSESSSPMQSLERALVDVKDKVTHLPGSKSKDYGVSEFNILTAVLWGNVLYMVQFGKGGSFLVRSNQVKPVSTSTEGNFSVASGVVKGEDVVILGTQDFNEAYKAKDLISGNISISMHDLTDSAAALLLKFEVMAELTEEEKINFSPEEGSQEEPQLKKRSSLELAKKSPPKLPKISISKAKTSKKFDKKSYLMAGGLLLLVGIIAFSVFRDKADRDLQEESVESEVVMEESIPNELVSDVEEVVDTSNDEQFKIKRIDPQIFYDLKLTDESASPSEIIALDSELIVSDISSGTLYYSSSTTPKFESFATFAGVRNLGYFGGDLVFTDSEGYKVYDKPVGEVGSVSESYLGNVTGSSYPYIAFLYSAEDGQIVKYQLSGDSLESTTWAQGSDILDTVSLAIDGSIYLLKDTKLLKFFSGTLSDFSLEGLDKDLSGATKVVKTFDMKNVYIADAGNKRILVVNEDGQLINQYIANDNSFDDIRSITISPDESYLYVLNGSRVFEIKL